MSQYCVDANVLITPWCDNYPPSIFPSLWKILSHNKDALTIIEPIWKEIANDKLKQYKLKPWLMDNAFEPIQVKNDVYVNNVALELELKYEISEKGKGAGKTDILLVAYAQRYEKTVVTLEALQPQPPKEKHNYKIPLICKKEDVSCINFVELLEKLKIKV